MYKLFEHWKPISIALVILLVLTIALVIFMRTPAFTRMLYSASDARRDAGLTTPEDIERIDNIPYGENELQVFDVYYPKGTEGLLPAIVSVHGGGYTYGTKETYQYYCMDLAQRGFSVVNFSYRLAPEFKYPVPLEDTNAVLTLVMKNAETYHIDRNNVFFVGDSAGAHLAAQYITALSNPEYAKLLNLSVPSFTLRACALNCGIYRAADVRDGMGFYLGKKETTETLDFLPYLTDSFPPVFLMSSTGDMCLPFIYPMEDTLKKAGIDNEVHIYGDESIKPSHVFHIDTRFGLSRICTDEECAFFRAHAG